MARQTEPGTRTTEDTRLGTTPASGATAHTSSTSRTGRPDLSVELPSNGQAIASLVTGMLAVTLAFLVIPAAAAILLGLAAIILGVMGMSRANDHGGLLKGTAVSGLVTGILGLLLGLAVVIGGVTLFQQAADSPDVQDQIERLEQEVQRLSVE